MHDDAPKLASREGNKDVPQVAYENREVSAADNWRSVPTCRSRGMRRCAATKLALAPRKIGCAVVQLTLWLSGPAEVAWGDVVIEWLTGDSDVQGTSQHQILFP